MYNIYQVNVLSENIFSSNHRYYTHENYLHAIIENKLALTNTLMTCPKKAINLLNLCSRHNQHMCSIKVNNSTCNMIACPCLEHATTCLNPYTKRNIDKLQAVQCRAARFVPSFHDYHPTADLSGKIQNLYSKIHCNTVELLQISVCPTNKEKIGRRILRATNDPRQMSYIFQQISVAIIRGNALAITASSRKYVQELVERH